MHFLSFNSLRNTFKSGLVGLVFLFVSSFAFGGGSAGDGICDPVSNVSWGGGTNCGCSWETTDAFGNTIINCAWGNCGVNQQNECQNDCSGTYFFSADAQAACQVILLPITLVSLDGESMENNNIITWTTMSELNNSHFLLEHSIDGENWNSIVQLHGAGNSSGPLSYRAIHQLPKPRINYYKLIQVDYDGKTTSYGPISIDNRNQKRTLVKVCNMLGQEVNENYRGIVIYHYSDGSYEKIYK